jgi:transposase-like protein
MAGERYNEEFKIVAVKQVTEGSYSIEFLLNAKYYN